MWRLKIADGGNDPYIFSTNNFLGRQTWEFDPNAGTSEERAQVEKARQHFYNNRFKVKPCSDLLWRFQILREIFFKQTIASVKIEDGEEITEEKVTTTLRRAVNHISALQASDGHWPSLNAGPLFYFPPLVFCMYVIGHLDSVFPKEYRKEILRYIYCHQNEDGGWGLHVEGHSIMFCTVLNYICMRILGEGPNGGKENACAKARKWIHDHGGVTYVPSWGKFWLSILGIFDWRASNPMPPEFWMLPSFLLKHPARMLCYCRLVYMPMSYLYGKRFVGPITPLILKLREELLTEHYEKVNWQKVRHLCAKEDLYYPHPLIQDLIWDSLYIFMEPLLTHWPLNKLVREKALQVAMKHIHYEDKNSRYITIGCVEKVLCMLACWVEDPNGDAFKKHLARLPNYLWVSEDGMTLHAGAFVSEICSRILNARGKDKSYEKLFIAKDSSTNESASQLFVDTAVYTRNRCFRLHLSSKAGKSSILLPTERFKCKNLSEEDMFMASLICNMDADCGKLLVCKPDLDCVKTLHFDTELNGNVGHSVQSHTEFALNTCTSDVSTTYFMGKSPFPRLEEFILSVASVGNIPGKIHSWYLFSEFGLMVYSMIKNRYCERIGRPHKSNNVIYVVDLRMAVYYQKCHDPDCRGYRSSSRPIPVHVLANPSVVIGSSGMLDDKHSEDEQGHQPNDNKPNFLQYEDTVEDNYSDSWWLEAIKVVEEVENKKTATELCSKEAIDDGDEEWWLAVESTASQVELTYTSTNSECSQHNSARQ